MADQTYGGNSLAVAGTTWFLTTPFPKFFTSTTAELHLMYCSLCLHLLLLRCPFNSTTHIANTQLNQKIHRRKRQREENSPCSRTRHEVKRAGRTQTLARNSRGTLSRLPKCGGDDGEGPSYDREADTGAETADGDHER